MMSRSRSSTGRASALRTNGTRHQITNAGEILHGLLPKLSHLEKPERSGLFYFRQKVVFRLWGH